MHNTSLTSFFFLRPDYFLSFNQSRSGATGYVGGEVLHGITSVSAASGARDTVITCLVRDAVKADAVRKLYPKVKIVLGDLDEVEKVKGLAAAADVVLST